MILVLNDFLQDTASETDHLARLTSDAMLQPMSMMLHEEITVGF